jgi:hypothetical protein
MSLGVNEPGARMNRASAGASVAGVLTAVRGDAATDQPGSG